MGCLVVWLTFGKDQIATTPATRQVSGSPAANARVCAVFLRIIRKRGLNRTASGHFHLRAGRAERHSAAAAVLRTSGVRETGIAAAVCLYVPFRSRPPVGRIPVWESRRCLSVW